MKLLASDFHFAPFRREKFLTQKKSLGELIIQWFVRLLAQKEKKVYIEMARIAREREIKLGIVNGDLMESSATERGLAKERDLQVAIRIKRIIELTLGIILKLNMGNHESGYNLPLSTDPKAGISLASIQNFLRLIEQEEIYCSFMIGGVKVVFIPYLFTEEKAVDFDISVEKRKFLAKFEADLGAGENPVVIFMHDPDSLDDQALLGLIRRHRERIKLIFCGHYHSEFTLAVVRILIAIFNSKYFLFLHRQLLNVIIWLIFARNTKIVKAVGEYFRKRKDIPRLIRELDIKIIPAPTGMFGIGGGFLTLDLETLEVKKY